MKNLIKLSIVVVAAMTMTTQSFAQVKIGVKAGLNIANMVVRDNAETYDMNSLNGFLLGATAESSISKAFAIETGMLLSKKGVKNREQVSIHLNYLEVPIHAVYKIGSGKNKFLIHAGPYLGFALSGVVKTGAALGNVELKIGNDKEKHDIKPLDFGWDFGAGVEIQDMTISFQYGVGLTNIIVDSKTDGRMMSNRVIGISVGCKFK